MERIFVTGGAGFIGSHVVGHHLAKGDEVWAIDNLLSGREENIQAFKSNPSFRFEKADLPSYPKLQEAMQWADRTYHMAAMIGQKLVLAKPLETLSNNIHGLEALLVALSKAPKPGKLLHASTSSLYIHATPDPDGRFRETTTMAVPPGEFIQENYRCSKLINELMILSHVHTHGLHCTMARIFNTIGTRQTGRYGMVVPTFVSQALKGEPITIYGDGTQTRSFCSVADTVEAFDLLLQNPQTKGEIVNIGNDRETSILELAKIVKERTKSSSPIVFVPYKEAYGIDFHDVSRRRPNLDKLYQLTGFRPKRTLEETLDEIMNQVVR